MAALSTSIGLTPVPQGRTESRLPTHQFQGTNRCAEALDAGFKDMCLTREAAQCLKVKTLIGASIQPAGKIPVHRQNFHCERDWLSVSYHSYGVEHFFRNTSHVLCTTQHQILDGLKALRTTSAVFEQTRSTLYIQYRRASRQLEFIQGDRQAS